MIKSSLIGAAILGGMSLFSPMLAGNDPVAGAAKSRAYLHSYNLPSSGIALEGYCPVAYFAVDKAVRGKPEFASSHNDVTYHFVSADAKTAFDADPECLGHPVAAGQIRADQDDHELVAAVARRQVRRTHRPPHLARHRAQHLVAGLVAVLVVQILELIEIYK